jgi:hypothetical protein
MQAVVFKEPFRVVLEERPIPTIQLPTDVVVKVQYTALCGRCVLHSIIDPRVFLIAVAKISPVNFMCIVAINHLELTLSWATSSSERSGR